MLDPSTLRGLLTAQWGLRDPGVEPHHGGMNEEGLDDAVRGLEAYRDD